MIMSGGKPGNVSRALLCCNPEQMLHSKPQLIWVIPRVSRLFSTAVGLLELQLVVDTEVSQALQNSFVALCG